jgi:hypothetical protein
MPEAQFAATRLSAAQGVVLRRTGSQHQLVNTNSGSGCVLNAMGRRIWALLASRPTFPAIVGRLSGARDHERGALARDAGRLLMAWQEAGLITWTS